MHIYLTLPGQHTRLKCFWQRMSPRRTGELAVARFDIGEKASSEFNGTVSASRASLM